MKREHIIRIVIIAIAIAAVGYVAFLHGPRTKNAELKAKQKPAATQVAATPDTLKAAETAFPAPLTSAQIASRVRASAKRAGVKATVQPAATGTGAQVTATGDFSDLRKLVVAITGKARLTADNQLAAEGPLFVPTGETTIQTQGGVSTLTLTVAQPQPVS